MVILWNLQYAWYKNPDIVLELMSECIIYSGVNR